MIGCFVLKLLVAAPGESSYIIVPWSTEIEPEFLSSFTKVLPTPDIGLKVLIFRLLSATNVTA